MGTIFARGMDTLHTPSELHRSCRPCEVFSVCESRSILRLVSNVEVQLLVVTTHRAHVRRVSRPVERSDVRSMLREALVERVGAIVADGVDVQVVVVRTNGKEFFSW